MARSRAIMGLLALAAGLSVAAPATGQCQSARVEATDGVPLEFFGVAVDVSGDAAVVGMPQLGPGSARIYRQVAGLWIEEAVLTASDGATGDQFGYAVAISGDVAVVGAYQDGNAGSAYVFRHDGGVWSQQQRLTADDAASGDWFGRHLDVDGDVAVVTAMYDDNGSTTGAAYVFRRDGGHWVQEQKLQASADLPGNVYGWSVSVSGDVLAVGSILDYVAEAETGSVYVYRFDGAAWGEEDRLLPWAGWTQDKFAWSVAAGPATIAVGAYQDNANGDGAGAAYVYRFDGAGVWAGEAKLTPDPARAGDGYGRSIALDGDGLLAGAARSGNPLAGAAFLHRFDGAGWLQHAELTGIGATSGQKFGWSVGLSADRAVVGVSSLDGAAYLFDLCGPDCNGNGQCDDVDVVEGDSADDDGNGVPDECDCPGDVTGDGSVDVEDLSAVILAWGTADPAADIDGDGTVAVPDLLAVLLGWSSC